MRSVIPLSHTHMQSLFFSSLFFLAAELYSRDQLYRQNQQQGWDATCRGDYPWQITVLQRQILRGILLYGRNLVMG